MSQATTLPEPDTECTQALVLLERDEARDRAREQILRPGDVEDGDA